LEKLALLSKVFEAFANSSESRYVFLCDLEKNLSRWSKSCVDMFNMPSEYMENADVIWEERLHPNDKARYRKSINDLMDGKISSHEMTYRVKNKTGEYVACSCKGQIIKDDDGTPLYFAGTIDNHGIASDYDSVTNLFTSYKLINTLREYKEDKTKYSILFVGLSHFAEINKVYGFSFGNKVLKSFANHLLDYVEDAEIFYAGGTKFTLIFPDYSIKDIERVYKEIEEYARYSVAVDNNKITLSISGSCSVVENYRVDEHTVFSSGIVALIESKEQKHGELVVFSAGNTGDHEKIVLMNTLRNCINDGCKGFYLCYQPVVDANTEKVIGAETLARWNMEPFGNIPPNSFIEWLETDPIFYDLSNWIMKNALTTWKDTILPSHPELLLSINLSYMQMDRREFRGDVTRILDETGFPTGNLVFELTERCRLLDMHFLKNELSYLKSKGIRITLDDFGTGFSALNLLLNLPIDIIKLDKAFAAGLDNSIEKRYIVDAVLSCAKNLNILTTVKGVETPRMRDILVKYGAGTLQGYMYSPALIIDKFVEYLNQNLGK
jgi:diguanylate cyclase (GGDEF)-like protein/PAS domain S-box-containing protein